MVKDGPMLQASVILFKNISFCSHKLLIKRLLKSITSDRKQSDCAAPVSDMPL